MHSQNQTAETASKRGIRPWTLTTLCGERVALVRLNDGQYAIISATTWLLILAIGFLPNLTLDRAGRRSYVRFMSRAPDPRRDRSSAYCMARLILVVLSLTDPDHGGAKYSRGARAKVLNGNPLDLRDSNLRWTFERARRSTHLIRDDVAFRLALHRQGFSPSAIRAAVTEAATGGDEQNVSQHLRLPKRIRIARRKSPLPPDKGRPGVHKRKVPS